MIKYNEFGEVLAVNGLITGHNFGTPLQDARPEKPEDNECYCEEKCTVTTAININLDAQPTKPGGSANFATGTVFISETVEIGVSSNKNYIIEHNLGYVPENILWFIERTDSLSSSSYLYGTRLAGFEYSSTSTYIYAMCLSKNSDDVKYKIYTVEDNASNVEGVRNAFSITDTTFNLVGETTYMRGAQYIPANSTVRWMAW